MTGNRYGIIREQKETPEFPVRELLRVTPEFGGQAYSWPFFGPNSFRNNVAEMQKSYAHPVTRKQISFREPTTKESINASAYNFKSLAKPDIFDLRWFQASWVVITSKLVFANPPKDAQGNPVIDEEILMEYLEQAEKVGGIYLLPNNNSLGIRDFGAAPYDSFRRGIQSGEDFAVNPDTNGLARILEHADKEPPGYKIISGKNFYPKGVNVVNFEPVNKPVARIVTLDSERGLGEGRLRVDNNNWYNDFGYASGVLVE